MKIKLIPGEDFRFWVQSESEDIPYLVDLEGHEGNGECYCWDFRKHCMDNIKAGKPRKGYGYRDHADPDRTQCKHIEIARTYCLDRIIQKSIIKETV